MMQNDRNIDLILQEMRKSLQEDLPDTTIMEKNIDELLSITVNQKKEKASNRLFNTLILCFSIFLALWCYMFIDRQDALESKIFSLENELEVYHTRDSIFVEILGLENPSTIIYRTNNNKPITYNELEKASDSCSIHLETILNQYPIEVKRKGDTYWAESAQIDSALMLLSVYRDMIKYDSNKKVWTISRYNFLK